MRHTGMYVVELGVGIGKGGVSCRRKKGKRIVQHHDQSTLLALSVSHCHRTMHIQLYNNKQKGGGSSRRGVQSGGSREEGEVRFYVWVVWRVLPLG